MNVMQYYKNHLRNLKEEYCEVGRRIRDLENCMRMLPHNSVIEPIELFYDQLVAMDKYQKALKDRIIIYEEFIENGGVTGTAYEIIAERAKK